MAGLSQINVAVLFTNDLKRSAAFYRDTIGFPVKFDGDDSIGFDCGAVILIVLDQGGGEELLTPELVGAPANGPTRSQLVSFVDNVDEVYEDLRTKGVEFVREPIDRDWGLRTAHFRDPDGNVWEIAQDIPQ